MSSKASRGKRKGGAKAGGAHRDGVVVQDAVFAGHKLEVDEVCSRPQDVVGHHSLHQLVLRGQSKT